MEEPFSLRVGHDRTITEIVYRKLREAILSGRFAQGQRLLERELVEEMQVSRTPIREALRRLELEQLVVMHPHRGAFVRRLALKEAENFLQVRAPLEGLSARLAAERRPPGLIESLEASLVAAEAALHRRDHGQLAQLNNEFHDRIGQASDNELLMGMLQLLRANVNLLRSSSWAASPARAGQTVEEHRRIFAAIVSGDPNAAEQAAVEHIWQGGRAIHRALHQAT